MSLLNGWFVFDSFWVWWAYLVKDTLTWLFQMKWKVVFKGLGATHIPDIPQSNIINTRWCIFEVTVEAEYEHIFGIFETNGKYDFGDCVLEFHWWPCSFFACFLIFLPCLPYHRSLSQRIPYVFVFTIWATLQVKFDEGKVNQVFFNENDSSSVQNETKGLQTV